MIRLLRVRNSYEQEMIELSWKVIEFKSQDVSEEKKTLTIE